LLQLILIIIFIFKMSTPAGHFCLSQPLLRVKTGLPLGFSQSLPLNAYWGMTIL